MNSRSTRKVFLATALLCCCVAALAVAGMVNEATGSSEAAPVSIAANVNSSGWANEAQQPATDLERKKTYEAAAPVAEEPVAEAKSLPTELGQKADVPPSVDVAPLAVDSAAQGLRAEVEPNGTAATATALGGTNLVAIGNIFPVAELDYWSFVGNAGDKVYAAVQTSFDAANSQDSELRLIGTDGVTVIETDLNDGSFGTTSSTIAGATLPAAGTFYLQVKNTSTTSYLRPYHLHFRLQSGAPTAETEPNDTPATANALPANGWVSGARNPAAGTEQDWYSFALNAGDTVFVSLDLDPERDNVQWNGRVSVGLFGDAGNLFLPADDGSTGSATNPLSEASFITVKNAGTYFVMVDSATAATGGPTATYALSVSIHPATPIGVNCQTYSSGAVNLAIGPAVGVTDSTINVPGNPRIEDVNVSITLSHALIGDIDAALLSPAGNENSLFTDAAPTAIGGQQQMDIDLDDEAGIPIIFNAHRGLGWQPEFNYRLGWLKGENGGGNWTLRLRDDLANNGGTLSSWSITICEPPPAPVCNGVPVTVYSSDFEADAGGFTHSGAADEWARGLPTAAPITTCNSGTNCWKTDLTGTYNANSNQDLLSPNISLSGLGAPIQVTWAQRYQMESTSFDFMSAQVREPGPTNVTTLFQWMDATMTDTVGSPSVTLNESAGWGLMRRSIDAYANRTIQLRWNVTTDGSVQLGGLAVDDVTVTACCTAASCNDGNPCTDDVCTPSGCTHVNNTGPCSDGNACTGPDVCGGGICQPGPNPCNDNNACTQDVCDGQGGCTNPPVNCDDSNGCTDDSCDISLGCQHANNTLPCTDNNACTQGDICAGGACVPGALPPFTAYCSAAGITLNDSTTPPTTATPYPSTISVAAGSLLCATRVRLSNWTHTFPDDIDGLLVSPAGPNAVIFSDIGGSGDITGVNLVLDDSAATALSDSGPLVSGTFRPNNVNDGADAWPAPAPAASANVALSTFTGTNPNGNWSLYLVDDANQDGGSMGVWCLELSTVCGVDADCNDSNPCTNDACVAGACQHTNNTNSCDDANACTSNDACSGGTCVGTPNSDPCDDGLLCTTNDTCSGGTCTGTAVNCDDSNACTTDACDAGTGNCTHDPVDCNDNNGCTADYCDPPTGCGHINQCTEFCNTDGITVNDNLPASPYPSNIDVSGVFGNFFLGGVKLNGITHTFPDDLDVLLVSPAALNAKILSDVGGGTDVTGVNLLLTDGASASIPDSGPLVSGNFKPTDINDGTDTVPGAGARLPRERCRCPRST
jgi:subtilisin-like proprotein convertase family protein